MAPVRERSNKKETKPVNDTSFGNSSARETSKSKKDGSFLTSILDLDQKYTNMCAVCANKDSIFSSLRPVMKLIEISCHGIPWLLGTVVLLLSVHQALHVEILVNLCYGLVIDLIIIATLKVLFRRSRPEHNEMDMFATVSIDNYSFPSGHASRAGLLACFFILQYVNTSDWIIYTLIWSLVVTLSRVVLGRHHLIDVICGYCVGIFEYLLLVYLWIPRETCMSWLELYFSHFHL